jgi:site-specific DNA-methyltransferase (adenine-specific)
VNKLYNADCFEILPTLEDESVDMILVDLPYGITVNKWDCVLDLEAMWQQVNRVAKPGAALLFTASQPFTSRLVSSNYKNFKVEWIWQKNRGSNFGSVRYMPMKEHESVVVFSRDGKKTNYYPIRQPRAESGKSRAGYKFHGSSTSKNYGDFQHIKEYQQDPETRCPSSVQKFNTEVGKHPTQKPTSLLEYLIKTYTLEGETVLDFTMGSGSTGVACRNTDRDFIGIELDEGYFKVAQDRIGDRS